MPQFNPGDKVTYIGRFGKPRGDGLVNEPGIVVRDGYGPNIFVVYHCDNDWENYKNYTGTLTDERDLIAGWPDQQPQHG